MINIKVTKNGRPVKGARVHYTKKGFFGGSGHKATDTSGYASFDVDPGFASLKIAGPVEYYSENIYLDKNTEVRLGLFKKAKLSNFGEFFKEKRFSKIFIKNNLKSALKNNLKFDIFFKLL